MAHDGAVAAETLEALGPAVRAVIRHVLGKDGIAADVDDCAGEVFRRAIEARARLAPGAPLGPWVLGIARHVALDARRASRRARRDRDASPSASGRDSGDAPSALDQVPDPGPDPYERIELARRARRLQAALEALPDEQRRAVLLHGEGYGYREIGERMSAPIGTICTWISRARQGLAKALKEDARQETR